LSPWLVVPRSPIGGERLPHLFEQLAANDRLMLALVPNAAMHDLPQIKAVLKYVVEGSAA
jgi:hypothetical protein